MNELQEMLVFLQDVFSDPQQITGWVNGNLYKQTSEVFGVLPIPQDMRTSSGMAEFEPFIDSKQRHHFLAGLQGTRKPVLPVHTIAERNLFSQLMREDSAFNSATSAPNWKQAIKVWNRFADTNDGISYKDSHSGLYVNAMITHSKSRLTSVGRTTDGLLQQLENEHQHQTIPFHDSRIEKSTQNDHSQSATVSYCS
jgi:hypothetical protein